MCISYEEYVLFFSSGDRSGHWIMCFVASLHWFFCRTCAVLSCLILCRADDATWPGKPNVQQLCCILQVADWRAKEARETANRLKREWHILARDNPQRGRLMEEYGAAADAAQKEEQRLRDVQSKRSET
jgi:hypothetical protein